MKKGLSSGTRIGVLGGGQLAWMLCQAALRMGLKPRVLAESPSDPAVQLCPDAVLGGWKDPRALRELFAQVDIVSFENEFVDCDLLEKVARELPKRVEFRPGLQAIRQLQDKLEQKRLLAKLEIPCSEWVEFDRKNNGFERSVKETLDQFSGAAVFKWARLGYDGKGTFILSPDRNDPETIREASRFVDAATQAGIPVFAERWIPFSRELAMVVSHSVTGDLAFYPLVISEQRNGVCKKVLGPATALGISPELEERAREYATKIARAVPVHGTFALELFLGAGPGSPGSQGAHEQLWVNELAPRVHNTGHYTQDAADTSQFENHWRAILGEPLGATSTAPAFAMLNLLGPDGVPASPAKKPSLPQASEMHLHWYGKAELRPGRKMGHINCAFQNAGELRKGVRELESLDQAWVRSVKEGES